MRKYSIDTSSLVDAGTRWYPRDVFPSLWEKFDELFESGVIVASEEVRHEISRKDDQLKAWATPRAKLFIPHTADVQEAAKSIVNRFKLIADQSPGKSFGDPFVIAVAQINGLAVVSAESAGHSGRPRIPFICQELGVPCMNTLAFLRAEKFRF